MPTTQVDFKYIRENADFPAVLASYGITLVKDGTKPDQYKCLCPFHDDEDPSLKVNIAKNIFNCFVCGEHGNVLDFVMKMDGEGIRNCAKKVADISGIPYSAEVGSATSRAKPKPARTAKRKREAVAQAKPAPKADDEEVLTDGVPYNPALTFELKNLQTEHQFLEERGITPDMVETFGLGIAGRGMMKGRLVFPVHNIKDELVAYCGRLVEGEPSDEAPKYKFPPRFRKDLEVFNLNRMHQNDQTVILVESFLSVVKLHDWGFSVASPMGRSMSDQQIELLHSAGIETAYLLFDGDDPGRTAVTTVGRQLLAAGVDVLAPVVAEDFKPHRLSKEQISDLLQI